MLRPNKDHHKVIEQQPGLLPKVTKSSGIFLIPGDDEMVQHIFPFNESGPQDIFSI